MSIKKAIQVLHHKLRDDFTINRSSLVCMTPTDELIGVTLDGSSHNPDMFYVWIYWLPLYAPTEYIYFNFGDRIRHKKGELWSLPLLTETHTFQWIVQEILRWRSTHLDRSIRLQSLKEQFSNNNFHSGRALFYDFAMHHEFREATQIFDSMSSRSWTKPWQIKRLREMEECFALFSNQSELDERLRENIETTKSNLSLP